MHQVRNLYQPYSGSFASGQQFGKRSECFRVRMADGDGVSFFARIFEGQRQLMPDGRYLSEVVEERYVAESAADTIAVRAVESDGGRGSAAVDEERFRPRSTSMSAFISGASEVASEP